MSQQYGPTDVRAVDDVLGRLSPEGRMIALACAVIMRKEGERAAVSILSLLPILTSELPLERRMVFAELTRDCADIMERPCKFVAA